VPNQSWPRRVTRAQNTRRCGNPCSVPKLWIRPASQRLTPPSVAIQMRPSLSSAKARATGSASPSRTP
jgi:hypothetical protein